MSDKFPIIYSKYYDITFFGLQKLHPFDSEKYGKIYRYLVKTIGLGEDKFYRPEIASEEDLLSVHTTAYLSSLEQSSNVARIAELGFLALVPNSLLQRRLLKPMKYATGGTILGSELAFEYGWAINLAGGYHHAKAESGGGFCFFADIPIAVQKLLNKNPDLSVLVIDLDAHQGNGYQAVFRADPRIHILDVYNEQIYPDDVEAKQYIEFDYPLPSYIGERTYLVLVERVIGNAIIRAKPDIIIYNAGTDIFVGDPLGRMNVSKEGVIQRDEIVFDLALKNKVPILMVLSGGYSSKSTVIIGQSIENIVKNVISEKRPSQNNEMESQFGLKPNSNGSMV